MTSNTRLLSLLMEEQKNPLKLGFISIGSFDGWIGGYILKAHGYVDTILKFRALEPRFKNIPEAHLNVCCLGEEDQKIPEAFHNKILTREEMLCIFDDVLHIRTNLECGHSKVIETYRRNDGS